MGGSVCSSSPPAGLLRPAFVGVVCFVGRGRSFCWFFFACFGGGVVVRFLVSLCCCLGGVVASVRAGLAVLLFSGVFVVCSFALVGSCRVVVFVPVAGGFWASRSRASLLLCRLRALRASRSRAVAASSRASLLSWASLVCSSVALPAVPVGAPVVRSCVFGVWVSSSRRACALLRRSRFFGRLGGVLSPLPVSFPPAVWCPPSAPVRVAVWALAWRGRCPAGGLLPCSRCPAALLPLSSLGSGVSVSAVVVASASLSVPVSRCRCLLSGLWCVPLPPWPRL